MTTDPNQAAPQPAEDDDGWTLPQTKPVTEEVLDRAIAREEASAVDGFTQVSREDGGLSGEPETGTATAAARAAALAGLSRLGWKLPDGYRFDRIDANARGEEQ